MDTIFAQVNENVQIDGVELSAVGESHEAVDPQLEAQLEELQVATDPLLVEIAAYRRCEPTRLREKFLSDLKSVESVNHPEIHFEPIEKVEIDPSKTDGLVEEMLRLQNLNTSNAELIAKLERAKTVLSDTASFGDQSKLRMGENDSDLLNRQRRIARQLDLAGKLLSQA